MIILIIVLSILFYFLLRHSLPKLEGQIEVKGTAGEIVIKRNRWGVPFIKAQNRRDLFFGIGFVHAQDRLFQMDFARRLALGRLSEVLGERALELDKYYKDLLIEESIEQSIRDIRPEIQEILRHYCLGVNFFIRNRTLPPEFTLLGYQPEEWTIKDMMSVFKTIEVLLSDSGSELYNFKILQALGKADAQKFMSGVFGAAIIGRDEISEIYKNRTLNRSLTLEMNLSEHSMGSNNWVISGQKTTSGKPMLANDPHLPNIFPSYFYQIYGVSGELSLSGHTLPGIPFIVIGRTNHIGWGFTDIQTDVIDYFILTINPQNPHQYRCDGSWRNFETLEKKINVKGNGEVVHRLKMSCFGPVQDEDGILLARHSILQYPSTTLEAFYEMNLATSTDQFIEAVKKFSSPGQNIVFADRQGNIGYYPSGAVPIRNRGGGNIPAAASGVQDTWQGFLPEEEKPTLFNPAKGYIVTANNPVIPAQREPLFSHSWYLTFRADRIDQLIRASGPLTLCDNIKIQTDSYLGAAAFLIHHIKDFKFEAAEPSFVLDQLKKWNCRTQQGEVPYLFYRFEKHLARHLFTDHIKVEELKTVISSSWIYRTMGYPDEDVNKTDFSYWVDDIRTPQKETFYRIVQKSLLDTYNDYRRQTQKQPPTWKNLHTLYYRHPLGSVSLLKPFLNRGPYFMPGGKGCILTASFDGDRNFKISFLSTFRMILDFSDFSRSLFINSSGQSGHFMSPYYDDQIPLYINLEYRPMEDFSKNLKTLKLLPTPTQ